MERQGLKQRLGRDAFMLKIEACPSLAILPCAHASSLPCTSAGCSARTHKNVYYHAVEYIFPASDCTGGSQHGVSCLISMGELLMKCTGTCPASLGDPCGARAGGVANERGGEPGRAGAVPGPLPAPF